MIGTGDQHDWQQMIGTGDQYDWQQMIGTGDQHDWQQMIGIVLVAQKGGGGVFVGPAPVITLVNEAKEEEEDLSAQPQ
uniref:Uncharacterized protein n=1 Tax=Timema shepardi TaxID=629360 RepID=A0A7R9B9D9_TIMSH|nr:unnamed protein product [Timema shepardi]